MAKKQYAVLGLGNFGTSVALTLQNLGCDVIAADNNMERVQKIADMVSYAVKGDIDEAEFIRTLGVRNMDGVIIAVSENRESSIMATLLVKEEGAPYILAKANDKRHAAILMKIGADAIVYPEREMGARVAKNLVSTEFADWITLSPDYSMIETEIPKKWVGKTLRQLEVRKQHEVSVVGYIDEGDVELNPDPDETLKDDIILILVGSNLALQKLQKR
ncbi:potassium channel family protein [Sporofaciens sp. SGI.106]|uniref:potassium channel family protein n=1 Tax=Sporofaciens sp. SGI.106 TaxID=3420568 RepID=UPI002A9ACB78|nr:TrkA family potassium uptake protein [Lachnoclostridium sp.]